MLSERDAALPELIISVDELMGEIVDDDSPLFWIDHSSRTGKRKICNGPLGERLLSSLSCDLDAAKKYFRKYKLCPYFELFRKNSREGRRIALTSGLESVGKINAWIENLRAEARSPTFVRIVRNHNRTSRANLEGLLKDVRSLHKKHKSLLVVRMFLFCEWNNLGGVGDFHRPPTLAQAQLTAFLREVKRKLPNLAWYSWRLEHGDKTSFYHQLMLVFSGPDVGDDLAPGKAVADIWRDQIKRAKSKRDNGVAINCNAERIVYMLHGMKGLGIVSRHDAMKRAWLESAAFYLAKMGAYAKLDVVGVRKAYSTAQIKRKGAGRRRASPPKNSNEDNQLKFVVPFHPLKIIRGSKRR